MENMNVQIDLMAKSKNQELELRAIDTTKKLITAIKSIVLAYNSTNNQSIKFKQLKEVFLDTPCPLEDKTLVQTSMARIFMFLRLFTELNEASVKLNHIINLKEFKNPDNNDFIKADELIKLHKINDFNNVNDLFFSDYEHLPAYNQYL